ncbi:hypothetical protein ACQ4PT_014992 [Festuca glaucescens]
MAEDAPAAKRLARAGSFSGVWWKLGDAAVDPSVAERRLRSIADEEADLRARIAARQAGARGVRRRIAFASIAIEALAFVHAYWTARRRRTAGWSKKLLLLLLPPLLAIPASAAIVFAAFAKFQKIFDGRDQRRLTTLVAERKAKIGQFRGSHHNMQKLLEKYDPDAAAAEADAGSDQPFTAAVSRIKRSHSRLSIYKKPDQPVAAETAIADQPVAAAATSTRIKRSHSRLTFHIGDE